MTQEKQPQSGIKPETLATNREAGCLYAIITDKRPVSRRNRASWYLRQLNKLVQCDEDESFDDETSPISEPKETSTETPSPVQQDGKDINLISIIGNDAVEPDKDHHLNEDHRQFLVTTNTRVIFLSKSVASSIILDLSPSVVSVSSHNGCVFLDSVLDALKRALHLLIKEHEIPCSINGKNNVISPKVFVSVIAYTPFVVAKNNQVLVQNRRICSTNIEQVLVEIWICLNKITQEIHELVSNTCGITLDFDTSKPSNNVFVFPQQVSAGIIRHPGSVLEDIYELGIFSSSLMPRRSRLSVIIITDGLFASTNNLNMFRLKSIALSFISLCTEEVYPDGCFGYTPYVDLMKFAAKTTQGVYLTHLDLLILSQQFSKLKQIPLSRNPLYKLFSWALHSELTEDRLCFTPQATNCQKHSSTIGETIDIDTDHLSRFFYVDQAEDNVGRPDKSFDFSKRVVTQCYHDWRSFKQLDRNLDADFEQVLSCLLREGYLIKNIHFKYKESTRIVARLVLHWKHNLDVEQELTASYWSNNDLFDMSDSNHQLMLRPFNTTLYGDTYCEIFIHGSYSFLHNLYCDKKTKRRSEYRETAYKQYRQLIDGLLQTHDRLQYLSRFYRDSSLSRVPSFLLHGNSLLYEQPHTHRLTSTIENVMDESKTSEFQEYWQKISCLDTKSWKNLMHIHTLRLVLEHDQPKHKNIHYQNANGRYTHVQCRRALSAISNFIKSYASFALLEDTTYIKFIYNKDDDLREIETSATKGFIVIRINKLLPIIVIHLMFTSGILDSHRIQIVSYLEEQLTNYKLRNVRTSTVQVDSILKSKTIAPSSESCCVLIRSPLERMLKVYSRNFINDYLIHNLSHGLPGSCPYSMQQSIMRVANNLTNNNSTNNSNSSNNNNNSNNNNDVKPPKLDSKENVENYQADESINRYNLIFSKYLYGVRTIHTLSGLPHDIIPSLAANVLSKISAILVNFRIKQGFHIAFSNSGILNLVVELDMKDHSSNDEISSCLCQYIVFPPTVVSSTNQSVHAVLGSNPVGSGLATNNPSTGGSKPASLNESESSFIKSQQTDLNQLQAHNLRNDNGEVKVIQEYWIEQQYGLSTSSESYHESLENMRYSEVVDHLFITDLSIFECLLTYDLLQLLCDKLSNYYDLDSSLTNCTSGSAKSSFTFSPIVSPTTGSCSVNPLGRPQQAALDENTSLPSNLIEFNIRGGNSKVPLLELDYKFSVTKFLDYCQLASLNVLLFRHKSEYYEASPADTLGEDFSCGQQNATKLQDNLATHHHHYPYHHPSPPMRTSRKMSMDMRDPEHHDMDHLKKEHRSSYQHDHLSGGGASAYVNPICSISLNHMFLDTLHKRLKQMHDKELNLSEYDLKRIPLYLRRRVKLSGQSMTMDMSGELHGVRSKSTSPLFKGSSKSISDDEEDISTPEKTTHNEDDDGRIDWRCFLRKGNQENLMIVLVPASLTDVSKWLSYAHQGARAGGNFDPVCPIFVFRSSSTMINDHVLSFLDKDNEMITSRLSLEADLELHFGQPCRYMNQLKVSNDELVSEVLPLIRQGTTVIQNSSDEKTLEAMHFRAFLRKIKNTVLKSRFSSLNEAYLSELFVHKDDILYYMNNVDIDTQKKYHVSTHLKSLSEFIKSYQDYSDSMPKEPQKACNPLLNSILLQKCGLFINQPIARFNEANPLIRQLHDKKLLFLMRCNYKVELPILEENLAGSSLLRDYLSSSSHNKADSALGLRQTQRVSPVASSSLALSSPITEAAASNQPMSQLTSTTSSLGKNESFGASRLFEMKCGSVGAPGVLFHQQQQQYQAANHSHRPSLANQMPPRAGSNSALSSSALGNSSSNDSLILEAFRRTKSCPIKELHPSSLVVDVSLRHEAHMAQVMRRTSERKESHQYRRVLKSKQNYSQSHGAIDQALKRVDSLGRLEHFCLTPLLFSPNWRSRLAPVRDHTIESHRSSRDQGENYNHPDLNEANELGKVAELPTSDFSLAQTVQQDADERWHQMVCNNYIKEYEQYIQTLGFNSVQIRYQSSSGQSVTSKPTAPTNSSTPFGSTQMNTSPAESNAPPTNSRRSSKTRHQRTSVYLRKGPSSGSSSSLQPGGQSSSQQQVATYNTGYLIKFLNRGCLVFKVGFCKPYVYSILYSIEGERFNNTNLKTSMTNFLDELDNIKVTMHLHSFTYDYHLRSMYSYIAGRQLTFNPGYHLISFLDDFRKYYQKAPNYARNHILCGEVQLTDIKVTGQQLYNYIVTHNSIYNMEVLEMISSSLLASQHVSHSSSSSAGRAAFGMDASSTSKTYLVDSQGRVVPAADQQLLLGQTNGENSTRSHANDYVLIELKREKVFYQDGKDPDVFDCGLLITHDFVQDEISATPNCLTLKYFLLLTNQRDLYPKLVHDTHDNDIISLGCHRPIRLGVSQLNKQREADTHKQLASAVNQLAVSEGPMVKQHKLSDCATTTDGQSELQSSDELSGPQSIISTTNSIQSSSSGQQLASYTAGQQLLLDSSSSRAPTEPTSQDDLPKPASLSPNPSSVSSPSLSRRAGGFKQQQSVCGNNSDSAGAEETVAISSSKTKNNATQVNKLQERTICDEEITYLGYFSSDEMDMLKFLQEKRANLRRHIEQVVKLAEVHYRRDYLWHRLMQRTSASSTKLDELPLSLDELAQLLSIVDSIDLASLDPQLSVFASMHLNWHMKLVKAFSELRQSSMNQHRIYTAKMPASLRLLLLYIDPKCTTAFILLSIDPDRGFTTMSLLLKDKQECQLAAADAASRPSTAQAASSPSGAGGIPQPSAPQETSGAIELDQDCQQLINDFINFCATFMWSTLLA